MTNWYDEALADSHQTIGKVIDGISQQSDALTHLKAALAAIEAADISLETDDRPHLSKGPRK